MAYSNIKQGASNQQPPKNKSLLRKVSGGVSYTKSHFLDSLNRNILNAKSPYNKKFDFFYFSKK